MPMKWLAVCNVCYTCVVSPNGDAGCSKRDANRAATSHIAAYQHDVAILSMASPPKRQPCRHGRIRGVCAACVVDARDAEEKGGS